MMSKSAFLKNHSAQGAQSEPLKLCQHHYPLTMYYNNGSTEFCTDGNTIFARSTEVVNFCASSNHIVSVHKIKKCSYINNVRLSSMLIIILSLRS